MSAEKSGVPMAGEAALMSYGNHYRTAGFCRWPAGSSGADGFKVIGNHFSAANVRIERHCGIKGSSDRQLV